MKYNGEMFGKNIKDFGMSRAAASDIEMEVVNEVNDLSPIVLLRHYEEDKTVDNMVALAAQLLAKKEVRFFDKGTEVLRFIYDGVSDFGECFKGNAHLLDPCLKYCYSIMLKKLAAPSNDSKSGAEQSA